MTLPNTFVTFFTTISSSAELLSSPLVLSHTPLARGGYNNVSLLTLASPATPSSHETPAPLLTLRCVLRLPLDHVEILPRYSVLNEVGCLRFVRAHADRLQIPVPEVYAWSADRGKEFVLLEYIDGESLDGAWRAMDEAEKQAVAQELGGMLRRLRSFSEFEEIGGIMPDGTLGPTVEGCKIFCGRSLLHDPSFYDIGPYPNLHTYALTYLDKEIAYFTHRASPLLAQHADKEEFDDLDHLTPHRFLALLHAKRANLAARSPDIFPSAPIVLRHGDLKPGNILLSRTIPRRVLGVIDWEFGGAYPLCKADDHVDVLEMETEEDVNENARWTKRIADIAEVPVEHAEYWQTAEGRGSQLLWWCTDQIVPALEEEYKGNMVGPPID